MAVVRTGLGDVDVPIHSAICFVEAGWDSFLKPFQIEAVWITHGRHLSNMIVGEGPLSSVRVLEVANELAIKLPSKAT